MGNIRFRIHVKGDTGLVILFWTCGLAGCTGVPPTPLRPGQEALTGGRAALSQWEFYDALMQMYQAQVMLNIVRLTEHGEAPLHFEFSDITATITDHGKISSEFKFFDSPVGGQAVGSVWVPNKDTNVTFTPSVSIERQVMIQAKARPLTRENWVYNWYYTMADQYKENEDRKFYDKIRCSAVSPAFAKALGKSLQGRPALRYRGCLYVVRENFDDDYKVSGFELRDTYTPTPAEELGALTVILSFLQESNPRTATDADIQVLADFDRSVKPTPGLDTDSNRLYLVIDREKLDGEELDLIQKVEAAMHANKPFVKMSFPVAPGDKYFERAYQFDELTDNSAWSFIPGVGESPEVQKLEKAIKQYEKLDLPSHRKHVAVFVTVRQDLGLICLADTARRISGARTLRKSVDNNELLKQIRNSLQRLEVQRR